MIHFSCPSCQQKLEIEDDGAGQTVACPSCERELIIPAPRLAPIIEMPVPTVVRAPMRACPFCHQQIALQSKICGFCHRAMSEAEPERVLFDGKPPGSFYVMAFFRAVLGTVLVAVAVVAPWFVAPLITQWMIYHDNKPYQPMASPLFLGVTAAGAALFVLIYLIALLVARRKNRYVVTTRKVAATFGVLSRQTRQLPINSLHAVVVIRPWFPRMFGLGNVLFMADMQQRNAVVFVSVKDAELVKKQIVTILAGD